MRRASKATIIALVGLPIFSWLVFPILYISVHDYISYLTESSSYNIKKISVDDFDSFAPDVTANSFHPATENELQSYPQVKESVEYFEGIRDAAELTNAQAYCDRGKCITYFAIKKVESAEFEQTFESDRCFGLLEHNQNYYVLSCAAAYDPPSYYFDGYSYGFWMTVIGIPVIAVVWIFHGWYVQSGEKMAAQRSDK